MPQIIIRPASKTNSTISHDDIPPQPLNEARSETVGSPDQAFSQPPSQQQQPTSTVQNGPHDSPHEAIAFHQLPPGVIQRILWIVDANSFASLAILNRNWYRAAQSRELYAHHLSRCPSYALANTVITGPFRKNDLFRLKTKFAAEVRRNLFEAYLRPRQTMINLISISASSSAALPGAEAFRFSFSPNGRTILALSSSRIYVIDATSDLITVRNELKTMRRPLAASVTDDGTTLAVLSSKHQANIYQLGPDRVKHTQVLVMDNPPRTITLAPEGTVLAAAYEGGVEVFSLAASALPTDRRAVRSEGVDTLTFSGDGSVLVGSTQGLEEPSAVVITAPFYTENDLSPKEVHSRMWTTQILFPQLSSICSHAELLQGHTEGDGNWLFAYDHTLMSYRAVRTDDTRTGVAYFLNPTTNRRFSMPAPTTAPTSTACGTLVVAGFGESGIWIYGIPEKLDVSPDMGSVVERHEQRLQGRLRGEMPLTSATGHLEPLMAYSPSISGSSEEIEGDSLAAKVDWRESLFVKCQQIRGLDGCTAAKWVEIAEDTATSPSLKRLILVAPGGVDQFMEELGDETMPVDGSRVSILDFDYSPTSRPDQELTIEVGTKEPELLTEQIGDMDIEVAMERRRTVRDRTRGLTKAALARSITAASGTQGTSWTPRRTSGSHPSSPLDVDAQIALANSVPRSLQQSSPNLQRSATAAGFSSARYPPRAPLSSQSHDGHVVYSRSPNQQYPFAAPWESPPPPYTTPSHNHVHHETSLGSPLLQPYAASGQMHIGGPLRGIPESGTSYGRNPTDQQSFISGPYQPVGPSPVHLPPQQPPHGNAAHAPIGHVGGHWGAPVPRSVPNGDQGYGSMPAQANRQPSLPASASPLVGTGSGGSISRPVSHEERSSPFHTPTSQRHQPMDLERASPLSLSQPTSNKVDGPSAPVPSHQLNQSHQLTLTGANLQARLNHPVPPTPPAIERMREPDFQTGNQVIPPQPNPHTELNNLPASDVSLTFAPPTADQMAHLNRRISQTTRKPVASTMVNGISPQSQANDSHHFSQAPAVPPSPPRGAWGAAGVPGSPSFSRAMHFPNGLTRPNSKGQDRVIPVSSSTPNLLAAPMIDQPRPRMGRLETIESISSSYGPGEPSLRPHRIAQPLAHDPANAFAAHAGPNTSAQRYSGQQVAGMQPEHYAHLQRPRHASGYQANVWAGNANPAPNPAPSPSGRAYSDTMILESSQKKKTKKKKGEYGRSQTPGPMGSAAGRKEKGSKCVVM